MNVYLSCDTSSKASLMKYESETSDIYNNKNVGFADNLLNAGVVVIEPTREATRSLVELGQLAGMRDVALLVREAIMSAESVEDAFLKIGSVCDEQINRTVFGYHQTSREIDPYVEYVLKTLGTGIFDWENILDELPDISDEDR